MARRYARDVGPPMADDEEGGGVAVGEEDSEVGRKA